MIPLVEQLQAGATDSNTSISELLRKAKVVAVKLGLQEFQEWIDKELNGYGQSSVPAYRLVQGIIRGWNPYHGWVPVMFDDPKTQDNITQRTVGQSVGELEELLNANQAGSLHMAYPASVQKVLMEGIGHDTDIRLDIDRSAVAGILNTVRNTILTWSLELERKGIAGEGMSFSSMERERAHETGGVNIQHIENFVGNIGEISRQASPVIAQVNIGNSRELRDTLKQVLENLSRSGLSSEEQQKLKSVLEDTQQELQQKEFKDPKIQTWITTARDIASQATGNLVAQGIVAALGRFIVQ